MPTATNRHARFWPRQASAEAVAGGDLALGGGGHPFERGVQHAPDVDPGVMAASLAAAWKTSGPNHLMQATTSMPCHIRCEGLSRAELGCAEGRPASSSVSGENTRLCGCISMATRASFARARPSISVQNFAATSHW